MKAYNLTDNGSGDVLCVVLAPKRAAALRAAKDWLERTPAAGMDFLDNFTLGEPVEVVRAKAKRQAFRGYRPSAEETRATAD